MKIKTKQQSKKIPASSAGKPKLRFPEFSGDWEEKRLKAVGNIVTGITPPTQNGEYYDGKIPWVTPTDINEDKNIYTSAKLLSEKGLKKGRFIPKDSLLVTCIASIGKNAILRVNGSCNQQINVVVLNKQNNVDFLYYLLEHKKQALVRFAGAGGMYILNKKDFSNLKFTLPFLSEQQKIAGFLGGVDEWIENLKRQKEELEKYKKGIMQKIFSQEIRFKPARTTKLGRDNNGKNFPEWEEKRLGEVIEEINEKTTVNNQYPILSSSKSGIYLQSEYFNKQTASNNTIGYKIIKRGEFTYRSMSDTGNFTFNIQNLIDIGIVSPAYPVFKVQYEKAEPMFLFYYLNCTSDIKRQILKLKQGGTRFALNFNKFQKFKINIPILPEQQKIASFLSAIDKKKELVDDQIQKMQEWKRGLIQGLFV